MHRRDFLVMSAGVSSSLIAGCTSLFESQSTQEPPVVDDRPDAVYHPTHIEGMEMAGMANTDWYTFALSYSFPHRFWTVTGQQTEKVSIQDDDSVHLMMTVWDTETKTVVPTASHSLKLTKDGESVDERSLWPMLSQSMGYHFGDNIPLPGDGTYTATIQLASLDARRTGAFADRFNESVTVEIEFDYKQTTRDDLMFKEFPENQGQKGAVEPMEMDMPLATTPTNEELPGEFIGESTSGDGIFLATAIDKGARFGTDGQPYLAVSPRAPYNRFPLLFMSLAAVLTRDGDTVFDGSLQPTIDPELNYHYGVAVESIESGDTLTLTVESPPQVARHEGYETAFLEMADMEFTV